MKITDECSREGMKIRSFLRSVGAIAIITIVTLGALEIILRVVDLRELREGVSERSLTYQYDDELGWMPVARITTGKGLDKERRRSPPR
jgi:hypothetical protein